MYIRALAYTIYIFAADRGFRSGWAAQGVGPGEELSPGMCTGRPWTGRDCVGVRQMEKSCVPSK